MTRRAGDADALKAFGRTMRQLRVARGLTQEQVSNAAGLDGSAYRVLEGAERDARFLKIRSLLIALPDVEWSDHGRALQEHDPLESRSGTPRRLRDMPHQRRPDKPLEEGLVGLAIVTRAFREGIGLSQETFAFQSGLDRVVVGDVERARRNLGFLHLRRWVRGLGLAWTDFFNALDVVDRLEDARDQTMRRVAR